MVRLAKVGELDEILSVYEIARQYMRDHGNMLQWLNGYPKREMLMQDIEKEELYVYEVEGEIHGVFTLIFGWDPTYGEIDGAWKNEEPYATIHRVGSDGKVKGIFDACVAFAKTQYDNLKIDTYETNEPMQYLVRKNGFEYCGIIHIEDGTPRTAFQYVKVS